MYWFSIKVSEKLKFCRNYQSIFEYNFLLYQQELTDKLCPKVEEKMYM